MDKKTGLSKRTVALRHGLFQFYELQYVVGMVCDMHELLIAESENHHYSALRLGSLELEQAVEAGKAAFAVESFLSPHIPSYYRLLEFENLLEDPAVVNELQTIREAFRIMDEVLADLNLVHGPDQASSEAFLWDPIVSYY